MQKKDFCTDWSFCAAHNGPHPVTLPHDAMQEQGRTPDAPSGRGEAFFLGGRYLYEKKFQAPEEWRDQDVLVEFEGVMPIAKVFLNDAEIGGCAYGYSLFRLALSGLNYGGENVLRVEVDDTRKPASRWYAGAGIYRPVWLYAGKKGGIKPWEVRVSTISCDPAIVRVDSREGAMVEILDGEQTVASGDGASTELAIPNARLWSAETPNLYTCRVTLDGETVETTFGIRKIEWSAGGLTVNGGSVLLKGGCIHHDNGILGARSFAESEWRRVKRLKEAGFNAIRSAHNPICGAALDACDALGMYVMDEAWDMWDKAKNPYDYAGRFPAGWRFDLQSMVEKDYNHPSVILYSIGNEVTEPAKPEGVELAAELVRAFKAQDSTRPLTAGINPTLILMAAQEIQMGGSGEPREQMDSTAYNKMVTERGEKMVLAAARPEVDAITTPLYDLLDIAGYNYASSRYQMDGELHPGRIIVGSETFPHSLPPNWAMVEKLPYLVGDFMWTAWDYLGEVGLGGWCYEASDENFDKSYPWLLADSGAFDILGNDTAEVGMASAVWGHTHTPYLGVRPVNHPGVEPIRAIWRGTNAIPHWSWRGCDGNEAVVEVYSGAHAVELFLNGRPVGRSALAGCKAEFRVPYEPGELKAVAYGADGTITGESALRSADGPISIRVTREEKLTEDSIVYLDIALVGANGETECSRDAMLTISVQGGELLAFGSANPKTGESFLDGVYTTYYGRAQAVVRAKTDELTVRLSGQGLEPICETISLH